MPKLPKTFTSDGEEMQSLEAMPIGRYPFEISETFVVPTKAAKEAKDLSLGQILKIKAKIISGPYKGRSVFKNFNIVNPNEEAVAIAERELTSLCLALKLPSIDESEELHRIPFMGTLRIDEDPNGKYPDSNDFSKFEVYDDDMPEKIDKAQGAKKNKKRKKPSWD
ncbi:MAG: DUF669 domain-containing protein [Planctomycetes bacterium]|nr:DUF669 domain-containing protein [Planctomycetota bacterium]